MTEIEKQQTYCPYFRSWVSTNKGEITSACEDDAKRTIRKCEWTPKSGCYKFPHLSDGNETMD